MCKKCKLAGKNVDKEAFKEAKLWSVEEWIKIFIERKWYDVLFPRCFSNSAESPLKNF